MLSLELNSVVGVCVTVVETLFRAPGCEKISEAPFTSGVNRENGTFA